MRKMILTLTLAIASSAWTLSNALCLGPISEAMDQPRITINGTIQNLPLPCELGEDCPPCITKAIVTSDKTYYLTTSNQEVSDFFEHMDTSPIPAIYLLPLQATASGTPYTIGSFNYLFIKDLSSLTIQYFLERENLPSLFCDEWNIAKISNATGPIETIHTVKAVLGSDTVIESQNYVKLIEDGEYKGSLREGESGVIYYIPAGSAHEYLLYNFNAQVGDRLTNLWYGGRHEWCPNGYNATVLSISDETPRVFTIEVEYIISDSDGDHIIPWTIYWTEGIGLSDGPAGQFCPGPNCECSCGQVLLCAYKNGEQVYVSEKGEQYGCEYNYNPYETPTDTIPLFSYIGDDPGSSTVDPVDPNQVVAILQVNQLTIRENSGEEINYTLRHNTSAQTPALRMAPKSDSFREEVTISITESGEYTLLLTNPSWGYAIFGQFNYSPQGIDQIPSEENNDESHRKTRKILINGQILIIRGGKTFTLSGQITDGQTTVKRRSTDSQSLGKAKVKSTK